MLPFDTYAFCSDGWFSAPKTGFTQRAFTDGSIRTNRIVEACPWPLNGNNRLIDVSTVLGEDPCDPKPPVMTNRYRDTIIRRSIVR
jgi:hypothetical protein